MNEELYQLLVDDKYGHGATHDSPDQRDFSQDEIALGAAQIDWEKGYDIRNELGGDITIKNQFASLSCVGQAWAYYLWVLMVKDLMKKYSLNLYQERTRRGRLFTRC